MQTAIRKKRIYLYLQKNLLIVEPYGHKPVGRPVLADRPGNPARPVIRGWVRGKNPLSARCPARPFLLWFLERRALLVQNEITYDLFLGFTDPHELNI